MKIKVFAEWDDGVTKIAFKAFSEADDTGREFLDDYEIVSLEICGHSIPVEKLPTEARRAYFDIADECDFEDV